MRRFAFLTLICGLLVQIGWAASANITVFSETSREYRHPKTETGERKAVPYRIHFRKEIAGTLGESTTNPEFATALAKAISQELELRGFEYAHDPDKAEQLIIVHAGTTNPSYRHPVDYSSDQGQIAWLPKGFANDRHLLLLDTVLGYRSALISASMLEHTVVGRIKRKDLTDDLRSPRNYLIISGYDMAALREGGESLWLWRTHVNVEAGEVAFTEQVDTLMATASRFLGRNSGRIIRRFNSEVQIGDAVVVEEDVEPQE
jgi:hypothetical protein